MANDCVYDPPVNISKDAFISSMEQYRAMYRMSLDEPDKFWAQQAEQFLHFFQPYSQVSSGSFAEGNMAWFLDGKINACYNAVDKHLPQKANDIAIIWEGDEPDCIRKITFGQLHKEVCRFANLLKSLGVGKGDVVCIYMPMVPEAAFAMLACARIGAPHSVVFAGFSTDALRDRIIDGSAKLLITADEGVRGGRRIRLKDIADEAVSQCPSIERVIVMKHTGGDINWEPTMDIWLHEGLSQQRGYCPAEPLDSEDILFLLYTSGSTGKPKGVAHTIAGYLLFTGMTTKYVFDLHEERNDVFGCVADVGWITGHSYIVYGPLNDGITTLMFESTPLYPDASRYWDMVERHRITAFYTAPTAIRALMKHGEDPVRKHDLSSLRVLGSVGEPINPEAWRWYHSVVGNGNCPIVDTYWQTETGGNIITPLPGATPTKAGSATFPFFGVEPAIRDPASGQLLEGNEVSGVLTIERPWPGMARTIFKDHERFETVYLRPYEGSYFTGDGATRDKDGYIWVTGRVDDVLNVSGHRIGSAEVESALVAHACVAEAAVVGIPHDTKGSSLFAFVIPRVVIDDEDKLEKELKDQVKNSVGSFAKPDHVQVVQGLPKTRSGKIMRRLLRKIASLELDNLGDISTLADPAVVENLISLVENRYKQ